MKNESPDGQPRNAEEAKQLGMIVIELDEGEGSFKLCPFHPDHPEAPSMFVGKAVYHCWTCGARGPVSDLDLA